MNIRVFRVCVPAALLAITLSVSPAGARSDVAKLIRSWLTAATVISPPPGFAPGFEAILSFSKNGAVIVTSNLPGVTLCCHSHSHNPGA